MRRNAFSISAHRVLILILKNQISFTSATKYKLDSIVRHTFSSSRILLIKLSKSAGAIYLLSLTEQGYNVGSKAHVGVKSPGDEVQVNANVHYGHSTLASGVPVGVKLGASVGADATVHLTDKVQVKT